MTFSFAEEIRRYPFIRLTIPLIVGIVLALLLPMPQWVGWSLLGLSAVCFVVFKHIPKYNIALATGISVNFFLVAVGLLLASFNVDGEAKDTLAGYKGFVIGEVADDPKIKENNVSIEINVSAIRDGDEWIETSGRTLLYLEKDSASVLLRTGDRIVFSPELSGIENKGNPEEFDYRKYLAYNMIFSSDYLAGDDWRLVDDEAVGFRPKLSRLRMKLVGLLRDFGLSDDELGVMSAMTMGYSDILSDEIRHAYSSAGAMHILAVSGLHVGIIYGIIVFLLSFIKNDKLNWLKVLITITLIWLYALFTGLSPSVSRASLMFSLMSLGKLQKNSPGSLNAVFASMFILLVINPYNLVNIGFQLSYSAVIGIIILQPRLYAIFEVKNKFLDWIWSLTTVSVAAQLATMPLCFYYFHQFSNYFLLTNYVMIPISTIAIWTCFIFFAVSWIPYISTAVAYCLSWLAKAMNYACLTIEGLPFSTAQDIYIDVPQMILLFAIIVLFVTFFFFTKRYSHLFAAVAMCVILAATNLWQSVEASSQKTLVVYNISKTTAINIIDGTDNIMFANLDSIQPEKIEFTAKNNWLKKGLDREKYVNLSSGKENLLSTITTIDNRKVFFKHKFIDYDGLRLYVLDDNFMPIDDESFGKVDVDYVVLADSPYVTLEEVAEHFNFKKIIIASSNSISRCEAWEAEKVALGYDVHNVRNDGA
ncbi:MAG: ComEC/Rec2 family competence protein, partial [Bacteroidales bacterium]|nr:ComEC/Rec2 family competence protein [Bacteroidales bacterium]